MPSTNYLSGVISKLTYTKSDFTSIACQFNNTVVTDNFAVPNFRVSLEFASAEISAILFFANKILVHDMTHPSMWTTPYTRVRKSVIER